MYIGRIVCIDGFLVIVDVYVYLYECVCESECVCVIVFFVRKLKKLNIVKYKMMFNYFFFLLLGDFD